MTALLKRWQEGDRDAGDALLAAVYEDLREIAVRAFRRERAGHTLQPTAIANEACVRLIEEGALEANNRTHLRALLAHVVRRVLVDYSRDRDRQKRGGGMVRIELADGALSVSEDAPHLVDLDRALEELAADHPVAARVVELKFFGGLTVTEIAAEMEISQATVIRRWRWAKARLYDALRKTP